MLKINKITSLSQKFLSIRALYFCTYKSNKYKIYSFNFGEKNKWSDRFLKDIAYIFWSEAASKN